MAVVRHADRPVSRCALVAGAAGAAGRLRRRRRRRAEAPRPVLVVHPGGGAGAALSAFAGEIRAREESPLSFRVGGKLVRRLVDAGDRGASAATCSPNSTRATCACRRRPRRRSSPRPKPNSRAPRADRARYAKLAEQQLVSRSALDAQNAALRRRRGPGACGARATATSPATRPATRSCARRATA